MTRSASTGTGTALAKSAASSSFARGVTCDLEGSEGAWLHQSQLAALGELQQGKQYREHFPWFGVSRQNVLPMRVCANREQGPDNADRSINIQRARDDIMHVRLSGEAQDPIDCAQKLRQRNPQRTGHRQLNRLLRIGTSELCAPLFAPPLDHADYFANLLVLDQPVPPPGPRTRPHIIS